MVWRHLSVKGLFPPLGKLKISQALWCSLAGTGEHREINCVPNEENSSVETSIRCHASSYFCMTLTIFSKQVNAIPKPNQNCRQRHANWSTLRGWWEVGILCFESRERFWILAILFYQHCVRFWLLCIINSGRDPSCSISSVADFGCSVLSAGQRILADLYYQQCQRFSMFWVISSLRGPIWSVLSTVSEIMSVLRYQQCESSCLFCIISSVRGPGCSALPARGSGPHCWVTPPQVTGLEKNLVWLLQSVREYLETSDSSIARVVNSFIQTPIMQWVVRTSTSTARDVPNSIHYTFY